MPLFQISSELFPPSSVILDPDTHASCGTPEHTPSIVINDYLPMVPPEHIRPFLTGMFLANVHPFVPFVTITHQNRTPIPPFFTVTCPNPPNTIWMIEVIPLFSKFPISKQLACPDEISQLRHRLLWIFSFCSIEIAPEDAGVSSRPQ